MDINNNSRDAVKFMTVHKTPLGINSRFIGHVEFDLERCLEHKLSWIVVEARFKAITERVDLTGAGATPSLPQWVNVLLPQPS